MKYKRKEHEKRKIIIFLLMNKLKYLVRIKQILFNMKLIGMDLTKNILFVMNYYQLKYIHIEYFFSIISLHSITYVRLF